MPINLQGRHQIYILKSTQFTKCQQIRKWIVANKGQLKNYKWYINMCKSKWIEKCDWIKVENKFQQFKFMCRKNAVKSINL